MALRRALQAFPRLRTLGMPSLHLRGCAPGTKEEPRSLPPDSIQAATRMRVARGELERLQGTFVEAAAFLGGAYGPQA